MFNIGMGEIVLVLLVAVIIVGPQDLPKVARWLGKQLRKLRKLMKEIKEETGWDVVEAEIKDTTKELKQIGKDLDIREDLKATVDDVKKEIKGVEDDLKAEGKALNDELKGIEKDLNSETQAIDSELKGIDRELKSGADAAKGEVSAARSALKKPVK